MANFEEFFELFKAEMEKRGVHDLPNALAPELAEFCATRMNPQTNAQVDYDDDNNYVPIFSSNGAIVLPNVIDDSFETLEIESGLNVC